MPQFPFRQTIDTEDAPEQDQWKPPDYAKPVEAKSDKWTPPDYATEAKSKPVETPKDKEKKSHSFFKDLKESFDYSTGKTDETGAPTIKQAKEPVQVRPIGRFESDDPREKVQEPTTWLGGFAKSIKDQIMENTIGNPALQAAAHPQGSSKLETIGNLGNLLLPSGVEGAVSAVKDLLPEAKAAEREIPVRQVDRRAAPLRDTTPQQDAVAIAQTRDDIPRTAPNIAAETGIPKPSVRRTIGEIKKKTTPEPEITDVADFIKKNPTADMSEIEKFINSVKQTEPEQSSSIGTPGPTEVPIKAPGTEFQAPQAETPVREPIKRDLLQDMTGEKFNEDLYNKARERLNMGFSEKLPEKPIETPVEQPKKKFVSPFDKPKVESALPDITQGFGGAGHPDSPEYVSNVLTAAGNDPEKPGLTVTDKGVYQDVTFRNKAGEPIATAKIVTQGDKKLVQDLAADKSRGLLTGRAMKQLGSKLQELGATESSGTISKDAENFLSKMQAKPDEVKGEWKPPDYAEPAVEKASDLSKRGIEDETEMHGGPGGGKKKYAPSKGPLGPTLDKLFQATLDAKDRMVEQEGINQAERASRFAEAGRIKGGGAQGAAKRLSAMRGEYDKVDPGARLKISKKETNSLFNAVDSAKITGGEKLRASTALFKLFNGDGVPVRSELAILDRVFGNGFADRIIEMHGGLGAIGVKLGKLGNTMKSMLNSVNLAAPILHGTPLIHTPEFREAAASMVKFMTDPEGYKSATEAIQEHPDYVPWRDAGLFTAMPESLTGSEEDFARSYVGDIPGVRNVVGTSNRGYTGFLNTLRSKLAYRLGDLAEGMGEKVFERTPVLDKKATLKAGKNVYELNEDGSTKMVVTPTKLARDLAKFINNSTDRGNLGKLEKIAPELNYVLWSPRRLAARFTMLNPVYYAKLEPFARRQALKALFSQAAAGTAMVGLGVAAGGKTSLDPRNADFGKVRFGDHVLNPLGPTQSLIVAASRTLKELYRMEQGQKQKFGEQTIPEIGTNILRNREAPLMSLADSILSSKQITGDQKAGDLSTLSPHEYGGYTDRFGNKKFVTAEMRKNFTPIFIQDVQDLFKTDKSFVESLGLGAASLIGISEQNLPGRKPASSFQNKPMSFRLR